jgi:hypothetical protein
MNRQSWTILAVALALIVGAAGLLAQIRGNQRLGLPGVKTHALTNSSRLQVDLPVHVLDYTSESIEPDEVTLATLPQDTSIGTRLYKAPDSFSLLLNVVLMGTDRTSLHKPQFCLEGQGYHIDQGVSEEAKVRVQTSPPFELPVVKLVSKKTEMVDGQPREVRGVYVYWYVAGDAMSASVSGFQRMWFMADKLVRTGVLQRWAYVSCLAHCQPGQEDAAFERIKKFIAASAPDFQLYLPPTAQAVAARP